MNVACVNRTLADLAVEGRFLLADFGHYSQGVPITQPRVRYLGTTWIACAPVCHHSVTRAHSGI
jgi:hypothetical protein